MNIISSVFIIKSLRTSKFGFELEKKNLKLENLNLNLICSNLSELENYKKELQSL